MGDDWAEFDEHDDGSLVIRVDAALRGHNLRTAVFHEFIHYVFYISGVTHKLKDDEEMVVRAIENLMFPTFPALEETIEALNNEIDEEER